MSEQATGVTDDPQCSDVDESTGEDSEPRTDASAETDDSDDGTVTEGKDRSRLRRFGWTSILVWAVLPGLVFLLAIAAGYLKWQDGTVRESEIAGTQALEAARQGTVVMLSYKPDTVDKDLTAASDYLTGGFRDSYTKLIQDVVIPGAKQQRISAVATVPAAAKVSADANRAVVLVFVNQTTIIGDGAPTDTASAVRVKLDKVGDRWLISDFQPI